jgi:GGDEF domain-containing protein/putative methionine-R-sulfoxide reductase with GAF domain
VEDESPKDKPGKIVPAGPQAIAKSSASLMGRGLRGLSGWDASKVIEAGKQLTSTHSESQIWRIIQNKLEELLNAPIWSLLSVNEHNELQRAELYPYDKGVCGIARNHRIKMGEGLIGHVAERRTSIVITDVQARPEILTQVLEPQEKQAQSIVAIPLCCHNKCVGLIELIDCVGPGGFPQADLALLESLADFAAIALLDAKVRRRLFQVLDTDELTGLGNARDLDSWLGIQVMLGYDLETGKETNEFIFSLVCVISDDLRNLAASLSYIHYTELLAEVGRQTKAFFKREHTGGKAYHFRQGKFYFDFDVDSEKACVFARRFHRFFQDMIWLQEQGLNVRLTASLGVATYPRDGRTKEELLHSAEEAVNLVKNSTGDGVAAAKIGILPPL